MPVRLEPVSCLSREAAGSPGAGQTQNSDSGEEGGLGGRAAGQASLWHPPPSHPVSG